MHILDLPNDILRLIFNDEIGISDIDLVDLCICRFVCRRFRDLIPMTSYMKVMLCDFVEYGYFNIIKWAWSIGAPINKYRFGLSEDLTEHICIMCAIHNRLDILQWAVSKGAVIDCYVFPIAVYNGSIEIMNWIFEKN